MTAKFSTNDNIVLLILLINVLSFSSVPLADLFLSRSQLLVILIFCFMIIINLGNKTISKPSFNYNIFSFLGFIIIGSFLVSSFYYNVEFTMNVKAFTKLALYPVIIFLFFYFFPFKLFSKDSLFEKFLDMYLYFAFINSIIAFLFMYIEYYPGLVFPGQTLGFFYHTNTFAFVFSIAIPITLYKYFSKQLPLIPYIILMLLFSGCLLFTFSRAGYIATLVGISILLYKKSKAIFVIGIVMILLIGTSFLLNFAVAKGQASFFSRAQVMYIAYEMIFNHGSTAFLWGYGVTNNVNVFQDIVTYTFGENRTEMGPHNFVFTLGIQYGMILAIACTIFMTLLLLKASFIKRKRIGVDFYQRITLSIAIVSALLVQCMFEDFIVYPEFFTMPILLIFSGYLYYSIYGYERKVLK